MARASELPMFFFAGMGADVRLFAPQMRAFPQLVVPDWLEPVPRERLVDYARRLAQKVDPGRPCILGGASFGGFVAIEAARHLQARAVFLIGSVKSARELPPRIRLLSRLSRFLPFIPFEWVAPVSAFAHAASGWALPQSARSVLRQLSDAEGRFLRWASGATLRWEVSRQPLSCPVYHIHGGRDHVLPARFTGPEVVLPDAGHVLSLTHAEQVTAFIADRLEDPREGAAGLSGTIRINGRF